MVSGFYRLMTLMFRAIARAGFFDDRSPPPTASSSEKIDVTDKVRSRIGSCVLRSVRACRDVARSASVVQNSRNKLRMRNFFW